METLSGIKSESWLGWFYRGLLFLVFLILLARLFDLQLIKGSYFRALAEENRVRKVPIVAPRGKILARGGETLAGNTPIMRKIIFDPVSGYKKVDVTQKGEEGETITEWIRNYELESVFAHASGYLGEANEDEVGKINPACPEKGERRLGDAVGRGGLEEKYDCILRGIDGEQLIEVDTAGRKIRVLGEKPAVPGYDLRTTVDFGLQKKVAEIFTEPKGAVIVSDPEGEILALYSSPSFDPNIFVQPGKAKEIEKTLKNADLPLFNRAIGGQFHPGSIFKPLVALASLSEGSVDKNFIYDDPGVITVNEFSYANWYFTQYGGREGEIDMVRAIARSTDTFFYTLGELTGIKKLVSWSQRFGLDRESGIDIPGEIAGLVPDPDWKIKVKGEPWFLGNTYHFSIGQGDLALTPIGVNRYISAIAAGGRLCNTTLVSARNECENLNIREENLEVVRSGMVSACSTGGTGFTFFDFVLEGRQNNVACKTGTAETNEDGKTHAWFVVFGPAESGPAEIVTTVLVEGGGEGSKVAGPIARKIFDYWFHER